MRSQIFGSAYPLFLFRGSVDKFRPVASDTRNELQHFGVNCLWIRGEDSEGLECENAILVYLLKSLDEALPVADVAARCRKVGVRDHMKVLKTVVVVNVEYRQS